MVGGAAAPRRDRSDIRYIRYRSHKSHASYGCLAALAAGWRAGGAGAPPLVAEAVVEFQPCGKELVNVRTFGDVVIVVADVVVAQV